MHTEMISLISVAIDCFSCSVEFVPTCDHDFALPIKHWQQYDCDGIVLTLSDVCAFELRHMASSSHLKKLVI